MSGPGNEFWAALRLVVQCINDPNKYFEKVSNVYHTGMKSSLFNYQ